MFSKVILGVFFVCAISQTSFGQSLDESQAADNILQQAVNNLESNAAQNSEGITEVNQHGSQNGNISPELPASNTPREITLQDLEAGRVAVITDGKTENMKDYDNRTRMEKILDALIGKTREP